MKVMVATERSQQQCSNPGEAQDILEGEVGGTQGEDATLSLHSLRGVPQGLITINTVEEGTNKRHSGIQEGIQAGANRKTKGVILMEELKGDL